MPHMAAEGRGLAVTDSSQHILLSRRPWHPPVQEATQDFRDAGSQAGHDAVETAEEGSRSNGFFIDCR